MVHTLKNKVTTGKFGTNLIISIVIVRILRNGSKMIILGWDDLTRVNCKLFKRKLHFDCEGVTRNVARGG